MNFDNMQVILKLVSGETIICQVISDSEKNMIIRDPYLINVHTEKSNDGIRSSTYYSDWFLGASSRVHLLRKEHVMSASIPDDEVKKDYDLLVEHKNEKEGTSSSPSAENKSSVWNDIDYKFGDDDMTRN